MKQKEVVEAVVVEAVVEEVVVVVVEEVVEVALVVQDFLGQGPNFSWDQIRMSILLGIGVGYK